MCGICGFVGPSHPGALQAMTASIAHRGPDDEGLFEAPGIGLGVRRLSIIDIAGGHQPISNEDGSLTIVFNGEIYNYATIREELLGRGHRFSTRSDTEVILHLYEDFGPEALTRLNGMFAIAIWEHRSRRLFLARDRLGIKPIYIAELPNNSFLFGSELKALLRSDSWQPTVDLGAIHDYLALRYVPGPGTLFHQVAKFPAGHYGYVDERGHLTLTEYWSPPLFAGPFHRSDGDYLDEFAELFEQSVSRRLVADVPVGAYLSGGIDSGTIVAAIAQAADHPPRTFTVGFDFAYDESTMARDTANLLGTQHSEVTCSQSDVGLLPHLVYHLDEPLGDPIIIPMYRLAEEARRSVKVVLAGEGADEILGGYLFHRALLTGGRVGRLLPSAIRNHLVAPLVEHMPLNLLDRFFDYPAALKGRGRLKVADVVRRLGPDQLPDAYRHLISLFDDRDTAELYGPRMTEMTHPGPMDRTPGVPAPLLNRIIDLQFQHWLSDNILMKQDKMSMAPGIEARVPFLDHELVEFALRLPPRLKIRGATTKLILRRYAERLLPAAAVRRRKMPFFVPWDQFHGTPVFHALVEDTLSESSVRNRGLFRPEAVTALRRQAGEGMDFLYAKQVFSLVVLELWFRMAVDRRGRES